MKKIILLLLMAAATFMALSCSSTKNVDDATKQAEINESFDKVYTSYTGDLVLDGAEKYTVIRGDTLTSITKKFYGENNGYYFPLIMLASRDVVKDPELIKPSMELVVPSFEKNITDKAVAKGLAPYFKDIADVYKKKQTKNAPDIRKHLIELSETLGK